MIDGFTRLVKKISVKYRSLAQIADIGKLASILDSLFAGHSP
jgi:hypothetical protein